MADPQRDDEEEERRPGGRDMGGNVRPWFATASLARDERTLVEEDPSRWPTGRLLSAAARKVERRWDDYLERWALSHATLPVLAVLAASDRSQRQIAAALDVTEQTVSRMLVRLERTGYIRRQPHPSDRRRHVVALTDAGRAVLAELHRPEVVEHLATEGLSSDETRVLRAGLLTILDG